MSVDLFSKSLMLDDEKNIGLFSVDSDFIVESWSKGCQNLFGFDESEVLEKSVFDTIVPIHLKNSLKADLASKKSIDFTQMEFSSHDKTSQYLLCSVRYVDDKVLFLVLDYEQQSSKNRISNLVDMHSDIKDVVISLDKNGYIKEFNIHATALTGYKSDEVYERNFVELFVPESYKENILSQVQNSFKKKSLRVIDNFPVICKDGSKKIVYWNYELLNQNHRDIRLFLTSHNQTLESMQTQKLDYLASYDLLTDLPNKNLFIQKLDDSMNRVAKNRNSLVVLYMDIKNFNSINHVLGIANGDKILQMVAKRLNSNLRDYDVLARFDGDTFVMSFDDIDDEIYSSKIVQRIIEVFNLPFEIDGSEVSLEVSIGASFYPSDANDAQSLISCANLAMRRAKKSTMSDYKFFLPSMHDEMTTKVQLEKNMKDAIENSEFFVVYQPLVDTKTQTIVGAEALVRWEHPKLKNIPPLDFIPAAEDSGLILEIGAMVMEESIKSAKSIQLARNCEFKISVNVSSIQLLQSNLVNTVKNLLNRYDFEAKYLQIELTESVFMENLDLTANILNQFKKMGVQIAIDDFGTGYSSLSYLSKLPIDIIKIDQSFVEELSVSNNPIVDAIISMSHALGLKVIAEGVEHEKQFNYLSKIDCDLIQGYYFSKPVSHDKLKNLLTKAKIEGQDYIETSSRCEIERELKELIL